MSHPASNRDEESENDLPEVAAEEDGQDTSSHTEALVQVLRDHREGYYDDHPTVHAIRATKSKTRASRPVPVLIE